MKQEPKKQNFIKIEDHGFRPPELNLDDYVLGGTTKIPDEVIKINGNWLDYLVEKEYQAKYGVESMGCTGFGTLNAIEILDYFLYNLMHNWSDRGINILANNTQNGNNPNNPAEALRKIGIFNEKLLPFDEKIKTWQQFHSPKPLPQNLLLECSNWLEKYEFKHEWVKTDANNLMRGLTRAPLGISVCAWKYRNGKYFKDPTDRDNHWCVLVNAVKDVKWQVFDTYDGFVKDLEWNYKFQYAKRYYLKKKLNEADPESQPADKKNMNLTAKFRTESPIYIKSNTHPKTFIWICDPINKDSYEDYKTLINEGLIPPEGQEEIIDDSLKPTYTILKKTINLDYIQPEINAFSSFWKWIQGLFGK